MPARSCSARPLTGKTLAGWLVIDMDATLVTASSGKEGAAPAWKKGYGFHPLGAWLANTRECLAMLLRPGNAGSNTFTDHQEVLAAAIGQVPARFRRKILIRVDGAGTRQDGTIEEDKDIAEITGLMSRAGNSRQGLRWTARRVTPSRRT